MQNSGFICVQDGMKRYQFLNGLVNVRLETSNLSILKIIMLVSSLLTEFTTFSTLILTAVFLKFS